MQAGSGIQSLEGQLHKHSEGQGMCLWIGLGEKEVASSMEGNAFWLAVSN